MLARLKQLSGREQLILGIAGLALLGLLFHAIVLEPYQRSYQQLTDDIEQSELDLDWMRDAVFKLPVGGPKQVGLSTPKGSLTTLVDKQVRSRNMTNKLSQMSRISDSQLRVRFKAVDFNQLLNLIGGLNMSGLKVKDIRITPTDLPADVDVTLVLISAIK